MTPGTVTPPPGVAGDRIRERTLSVPGTAGYLDGHFPGFPVVPAVVQVQWVMELARELAGRPLVLERIEALKFRRLLRPGQVLRLRVALVPTGDAAEFRLWGDGHLSASGRCVFAPHDEELA